MSAGMAHELNQPLTVISTLAEGMLMRLEAGRPLTGPAWSEGCEGILESVERMRRVTDHLRIYAREHAIDTRERVDLRDVVDGALTLTEAQLRSRGIDLDTAIPDDPAVVQGQRFRLEQVLVNLLQNARDAIDERLETARQREQPEPPARIAIAVYREASCAVLEVADTGAGMDEDTQARMLDPFFTRKAPDRGTGLGLSIAHGIVREHGGVLHCRSRLGAGTTFRVDLPIPD